jgi:hypothetical protein
VNGKIQVEINIKLFYTFLGVWLLLLAAQLTQDYTWAPKIPTPLLALFHQITGMLLTVFTGFVGFLKMNTDGPNALSSPEEPITGPKP